MSKPHTYEAGQEIAFQVVVNPTTNRSYQVVGTIERVVDDRYATVTFRVPFSGRTARGHQVDLREVRPFKRRKTRPGSSGHPNLDDE
jgi:hypothetical protein